MRLLVTGSRGSGGRGLLPFLAARGCDSIATGCIESVNGREFPLTTARLRAIRETSVFPCDKLVAAGFTHPQTTREGLAEMLAWLETNKPAV